MSKKLIQAVAYLRKSTKGKDAHGRQRQEKSIGQQRREVEALAKEHGYKIVREYRDEGISGWKRGDDRPGFQSMLSDARSKRDFQAVLCDDLDRFSRAEVMEAFSDLSGLAAGGVTILHCVNQGSYDLGEGDIGRIIKLVVDCHGGNEFSRKLGRRIALSRRNAATAGRRSGGKAPFGYANDGHGGLMVGSAENVAIVRQMFHQFDTGERSLRSLANDLNERGIPSPRGFNWSGATMRWLLTNPAYRGEFVYNRRKSGQFYFVDEEQEVREARERKVPDWALTDAGTFRKAEAHVAIIEPALFDRVQAKIKAHKKRRGQIRKDGYPLSGVLRCGHCGKPMWAATRRKVRLYTCGTTTRKGTAVCRAYSIREDAILPFIIERLREELSLLQLAALKPEPPKPFKPPGEQLRRLQGRVEELEGNLARCRKNLALAASDEVFRQLSDQVTEWAAERDQLQKQIADAERFADADSADVQAIIDYNLEYAAFLRAKERELILIWKAANENELLERDVYHKGGFKVTARSRQILADVAKFKQLLRDLGCEVTLYWREALKGRRPVLVVDKGRFRLGQRIADLEPSDGRLCEVPVGVPCSGSRVAGRCDSRRGTG